MSLSRGAQMSVLALGMVPAVARIISRRPGSPSMHLLEHQMNQKMERIIHRSRMMKWTGHKRRQHNKTIHQGDSPRASQWSSIIRTHHRRCMWTWGTRSLNASPLRRISQGRWMCLLSNTQAAALILVLSMICSSFLPMQCSAICFVFIVDGHSERHNAVMRGSSIFAFYSLQSIKSTFLVQCHLDSRLWTSW